MAKTGEKQLVLVENSLRTSTASRICKRPATTTHGMQKDDRLSVFTYRRLMLIS